METIVLSVLKHAKECGDRRAVIFQDEAYTYAETAEKMQIVAGNLKALGIKAGDIIMLSAISKPQYVFAYLGIQYLNAIAVPIDKSIKPQNAKDLAAYVQPKLILADEKISVVLPQISYCSLEQISGSQMSENPMEGWGYGIPESSDTAEILFTSGTTGRPKGAVLSFSCIEASMQNTWNGIGMKQEDIVLLPLPLHHSFGMRVLRSCLYGGAAIVLQNGFVLAKEIEKNIENAGCTAFACVPAALEVMLQQMGENFYRVLSGLRYIEAGAGALSPLMRKKMVEGLPGVQIHNTWGSTETGGVLFLNLKENPDKIMSAGRPLEGIQIKLVDYPSGGSLKIRRGG